jgi:hypothetical protein
MDKAVDLGAMTTHFAQLRGDLDAAHKVVHATAAFVDMLDFMQKECALREDVDYFAMLKTLLADANGMLTAAGVEWDETESAFGPLGYDKAFRARVEEVANGR